MEKAARLLTVLILMLGALLLMSPAAMAASPAILEVSRPKQLTTSDQFDRHPSFFRAIDGTWWVFFARGRGDPDLPGYKPSADYYDVRYVKSADNGDTWTDGFLPATPLGHGIGAVSPAAIQDGIGKIWVFYAADGVGVFYFTSIDSGGSWTPSTPVPNVDGPAVGNYVDALVAQDGRIWIFYEGGSDDAIQAQSFDGLSWSAPVTVGDPLTYAYTPRAVQDGDTGDLHVVYVAGNPVTIYLATSTNNGADWTNSAIINTMDVDFDPVLVKDGSTWRVFFAPYISADDHQWLMTSSSTDLTTWTAPVHITAGRYRSTKWWDFAPEAVVAAGKLRLFYASLMDGIQRDEGDIFMFTVDWDLSRDHYEAIQPAVDAASPGYIVNVAAGTYKEKMRISTSLTLNGPNAGIDPNTGSRVAEAVVVPAENDTVNGIIANVRADDVTIDGFTFDGDNPDLSGGVPLNEAEVNIGAGIHSTTLIENVTVRNNILKNLLRGVGFSDFNGGLTGSSGNSITHSAFDNIPSSSPRGQGIYLANSFYAQVSDNVMTRVYVGIRTDNFRVTGSPALISDNQIQSYRLGIWHDMQHESASAFTIRDNQLTTVPGAMGNVGLWLTQIRDAVDVSVINNDVTGAHTGIEGWNLPTTQGVTITGGTLDGNEYGVWLYNYSNYLESPGAGEASQLTISGVTVRDSGAAGLRVQDHVSGTETVQLGLWDGTISGNPTGALVERLKASLNVTSSAFISNTVAVDIDRGPTTINNSFINGNVQGVLVRHGTATVNYNDLSANSGLAVSTLAVPLVNASGNWWGSKTPAGVRAQVSSKVDYTPWLDAGTDTEPGTPGFQGDLSELHVDDDSPQTGSVKRIREGINMVSGSTVHVAAGTYTETMTFASSFNKDNLTILGDSVSRPVITGGARLAMSSAITGLSWRNLYLKGDDGSGKVINCINAGANNNFVMDNCVVDGENVSARHGLAGNNFGQDFTITNSEFMNILGWCVMDTNFNFGGDDSADLALGTVTFANTHVHHCNGVVSLRGHVVMRTNVVNAYGNTFEYIGNNEGEVGEQWAALVVNYAQQATIYNNTVRDMSPGTACTSTVQFRLNSAVDVHDNTITNNCAGIYFPGGMFAGSLIGVDIHGNVLCGNGPFDLKVDTDHVGTADAEGNWWGTNTPGAGQIQGPVNYDPWITWSIGADPSPAWADGSSTISVTYTHASGNTVPDGHVITWTLAGVGSLDPVTSTTASGVATTTLVGDGSTGTSTVAAHDRCHSIQTIVEFEETPPGPTPSPTPTATPVGKTTITIQKGTLGDSEDTYLYEYDPDNSDLSTGTTLRVGYSSTFEHGKYYGLLRFDLSPIPPAANIVDAKLQLYSDGWSGAAANVTMGAYAVLRDVTISQATWNQAQSGNLWGAAGCNEVGTDRLATPDSSVAVSSIETWYTWGLTDTVQSWVDGSLTNNGVLVRADSGSGFFAFSSSEGTLIERRPKLVVTYGGGNVPENVSVEPASGSGSVGVTTVFTTTWSDADGWQDLKQCYFHIGASPTLANNVTLFYNAQKDKLWILNDAGTGWLGGFAPGSANVLDNGQAQVDCSQTTKLGSGNTLQVSWSISFKAGYTGAKKTYLKCKDIDGNKSPGQMMGTWTIS
jgi:hypothetical protein